MDELLILGHEDLATHQSYEHKIGRTDEDAKRSLFEMVYPIATHNDTEVNYNFDTFHRYFPYKLFICFGVMTTSLHFQLLSLSTRSNFVEDIV